MRVSGADVLQILRTRLLFRKNSSAPTIAYLMLVPFYGIKKNPLKFDSVKTFVSFSRRSGLAVFVVRRSATHLRALPRLKDVTSLFLSPL